MNFKLKQQFKMFSQHILFPLVYRLNSFKKIENKVILADCHKSSCPPHMKKLKSTLLSSGFDVCECFFDLETMGNIEGMKKMLSFMKKYASAKAVFICDNFLPVASCKKRKGTKVIQLWHGCGAFKKFGYDSETDIPAYYKGNVYKNYDLVTVSGEACIKPFESAMRTKENVVRAIGVSNTDRLFDKDYLDACRDKFRYLYPDAAGKKIVLYAPTFRGNASDAKNINMDFLDKVFDMGQEELYIIKSLHPHSVKNEAERNALSSGEKMTTEELIVCADCLITDYSSVFFESILLNKRVIFYAPDYSKYVQERGYYLDYDMLPGVIIKDVIGDAAAELLYDAITKEDRFLDKRSEFVQKYLSACDGKATDRIIDFIR